MIAGIKSDSLLPVKRNKENHHGTSSYRLWFRPYWYNVSQGCPRPTRLRPLSPHGGNIQSSRPSAVLAGRCCRKAGGLERGLPRLPCASGLAGSTCVARACGDLSRSQGRSQRTARDFLVEQLFRDDRKGHSQLFRNVLAAACSRHVRCYHGDRRTPSEARLPTATPRSRLTADAPRRYVPRLLRNGFSCSMSPKAGIRCAVFLECLNRTVCFPTTTQRLSSGKY